MKKIVIALCLPVVFCINGAFANKTVPVNEKVQETFKNIFAHAKEVNWEKNSAYSKATFKLNEELVTAFFTEEGDYVGLVRNILSSQLPIRLQTSLQKQYEGYWISDLLEYAKDNLTGYYMMIENADQSIILQSIDGSGWNVFRRIKK